MLTRKTNASIRSIYYVIPHCVLDKLLCHQNQFAVFKRGVSFAPGCATDLDDPSTPNAELWYKILIQTPSQPSEHTFQMDSRTRAISLSVEGKTELGSCPLFCIEVFRYRYRNRSQLSILRPCRT